MKKIALLLILVCILMILACTAIAEKKPTVYTYGDYGYVLMDDCTAEICAYYGTLSKLDIPKVIDGYVVTSIGERAFNFLYCQDIIEITIPDSVTSIGDYAFRSCESLEKIIMPDSVTSIGDYAFNMCRSLKEITIPDSVTSFGRNPFAACDSLATIKVSYDHPLLVTIDGVLFDKLEKRLIYCPPTFDAKGYSVPYGIYSIDEYAFNCAAITAINIPDSVTSIGDYAFRSCESLTEIIIPDSVTSIGINPFWLCSQLRKIEVSPAHSTFETIDGVLFDKTEKKLICYPAAITAKMYSIPRSISSIWPNAFSGCKSLTEITIPDSVTFIGYAAFYQCNSPTLRVGRNSYAERYARENNIDYMYTESLD